jgi:hypothetical protein
MAENNVTIRTEQLIVDRSTRQGVVAMESGGIFDELEGFAYTGIIKNQNVIKGDGYPTTNADNLHLDPSSTTGIGVWKLEKSGSTYETRYEWLLTDKWNFETNLSGTIKYVVKENGKFYKLTVTGGTDGGNGILIDQRWTLIVDDDQYILPSSTKDRTYAITSDLTGNGHILFEQIIDSDEHSIVNLYYLKDFTTELPIPFYTTEFDIELGQAFSGTRLFNNDSEFIICGFDDLDSRRCRTLVLRLDLNGDWEELYWIERFATVSPMGLITGEPIPKLDDFKDTSITRLENGQEQLDLWDGGSTMRPWTLIGGYTVQDGTIREIVLDTSRNPNALLRTVTNANDSAQSDYPESNVGRYYWFNFLNDRKVYHDWGVGWLKTYVRNAITSNSGNIIALGYGRNTFLALSDSGQLNTGTSNTSSVISWRRENNNIGGATPSGIFYINGKFVIPTANGSLMIESNISNIIDIFTTPPTPTSLGAQDRPYVVDSEKALWRGYQSFNWDEATIEHPVASAATNGTIIIAVGPQGAGSLSTDGFSWTRISNLKFGESDINSIAFGKGLFVAVGSGSKIAYSSTGSTWTNGSGLAGDMVQVEFAHFSNPTQADARFIARNTIGQLFYSVDGITWTLVVQSNDYEFTQFTIRTDSYARGIAYRKSDGRRFGWYMHYTWTYANLDYESVLNNPVYDGEWRTVNDYRDSAALFCVGSKCIYEGRQTSDINNWFDSKNNFPLKTYRWSDFGYNHVMMIGEDAISNMPYMGLTDSGRWTTSYLERQISTTIIDSLNFSGQYILFDRTGQVFVSYPIWNLCKYEDTNAEDHNPYYWGETVGQSSQVLANRREFFTRSVNKTTDTALRRIAYKVTNDNNNTISIWRDHAAADLPRKLYAYDRENGTTHDNDVIYLFATNRIYSAAFNTYVDRGTAPSNNPVCICARGEYNTATFRLLAGGDATNPILVLVGTGTTWTPIIGITEAIKDIYFWNNHYIAISDTNIYYSTDAINWTNAQIAGSASNFQKISGSNQSSSIQITAENAILSTSDGEYFTVTELENTTYTLLARSNDAWFYANDTSVMQSEATIKFDNYEIEPFGANTINCIATYQGMTVMVGDNGTIATSEDPLLMDWVGRQSGIEDNIRWVTYVTGPTSPIDGRMWIAVGNNGVILTSLDGVDWTQQSVTMLNSGSSTSVGNIVKVDFVRNGAGSGTPNFGIFMMNEAGYSILGIPPNAENSDWLFQMDLTGSGSTDTGWHIPFITGDTPPITINNGLVKGFGPTYDYWRVACERGVYYTRDFKTFTVEGGWNPNGDNIKWLDGRQILSYLYIDYTVDGQLPNNQNRWMLYGASGGRIVSIGYGGSWQKYTNTGFPRIDVFQGLVDKMEIRTIGCRPLIKDGTNQLTDRTENLKLNVNYNFDKGNLNKIYYFFGGLNNNDSSILAQIPFTSQLLTLDDGTEVFFQNVNSLITSSFCSLRSMLSSWDDWLDVPIVSKDDNGWMLTSGTFGWRVEKDLPPTEIKIDKIADYYHRINILDNNNLIRENRLNGSLEIIRSFYPWNGEHILKIPPRAIVVLQAAPNDSFDFAACKGLNYNSEMTALLPYNRISVNIATGDREALIKEVIQQRNSLAIPMLRDDYDSLDVYYTLESVSSAVTYKSTNVNAINSTEYAVSGRPTIDTTKNGSTYYISSASVTTPIGLGTYIEGINYIQPSAVLTVNKRSRLITVGNNIRMSFNPFNFIEFGQDLFVIYGNSYFFDGQGIYYLTTNSSGYAVSQFTCYALGMKFLSNSGMEAFFWSGWDKQLYSFTGSNTIVAKLKIEDVPGDPIDSFFSSQEQILYILFEGLLLFIRDGKIVATRAVDPTITTLYGTTYGASLRADDSFLIPGPRYGSPDRFYAKTKWLGSSSSELFDFAGWLITFAANGRQSKVNSQVLTFDEEFTNDTEESFIVDTRTSRQDAFVSIARTAIAHQLILSSEDPIEIESLNLRGSIVGKNKHGSVGV